MILIELLLHLHTAEVCEGNNKNDEVTKQSVYLVI